MAREAEALDLWGCEVDLATTTLPTESSAANTKMKWGPGLKS